MASLVFSYAHADEALRNELEKHLSPLKRMGRISTWHDRRIVPGEEFADQIDHHFAAADIILLLVSSDFIASDYCYQIEMTNALKRHERGEAVVIPVVLRPCAWHQLPFGKLLAATVDGKPIVQFPSYDDGFVQVVDAVSRRWSDSPSQCHPLRPLDSANSQPAAPALLTACSALAAEAGALLDPATWRSQGASLTLTGTGRAVKVSTIWRASSKTHYRSWRSAIRGSKRISIDAMLTPLPAPFTSSVERSASVGFGEGPTAEASEISFIARVAFPRTAITKA